MLKNIHSTLRGCLLAAYKPNKSKKVMAVAHTSVDWDREDAQRAMGKYAMLTAKLHWLKRHFKKKIKLKIPT